MEPRKCLFAFKNQENGKESEDGSYKNKVVKGSTSKWSDERRSVCCQYFGCPGVWYYPSFLSERGFTFGKHSSEAYICIFLY